MRSRSSCHIIPWRTVLLVTGLMALVIAPFLLVGENITTFAGNIVHSASDRPVVSSAILFGLLCSDIVLPIPSSLVSTACGMVLGLPLGTMVSWLGMTLSCVLGYAMGRYSSGWARRFVGSGEFELLQRFFDKHGVWVLLALRPVPVIAEASMVFAGISRLCFASAMTASVIGNLVVSFVYATIGVFGAMSDSFLIAFLASTGVAGLMLAVLRFKSR